MDLIACTESLLMTPLLFCRFAQHFSRDEHGLPRVWGTRTRIPLITSEARSAAAQLLALFAVDRLRAPKVMINQLGDYTCLLFGESGLAYHATDPDHLRIDDAMAETAHSLNGYPCNIFQRW